jgi:hypothetical protein
MVILANSPGCHNNLPNPLNNFHLSPGPPVPFSNRKLASLSVDASPSKRCELVFPCDRRRW